MNIFIIIAFILGGGVIAFDKLVHELPQWLAIVLYSGAVVLFIVGMIVSKKS
ncbi:MAG: hypothetical protein IJR78_02845 [Clostridia bacterium]|jgi:arginine exporter protein ArgO|nr:hypothetical protein [Clostridia bacterium]MBQ3651096.1 hypothetical protein [Clostridia bacterium]MBQ6866472.1 hypothetical protein [Clostridia bacterium]MBQ7754652.1 hypothetical protein [Clostridia bacterium]MBQ9923423.1 hypothetical protein [Clostridia bacterium]